MEVKGVLISHNEYDEYRRLVAEDMKTYPVRSNLGEDIDLFISEKIINDTSRSISLNEFYSYFSDWYKYEFPRHTIPLKSDINNILICKWGDTRIWSGRRLKTIVEEFETKMSR